MAKAMALASKASAEKTHPSDRYIRLTTNHPLLDHLRWIADAASGRLKLLLAHFVLVLEALFGGHLLEALARLSLDQPADKLKYDNPNDNQRHNANYHYHSHVF